MKAKILEVVRLRAEGHTLRALGEMFGVSRTTIGEWLDKAGVPKVGQSLRRRPKFEIVMARARGATLSEVGRPIGLDPYTVWHHLKSVEAVCDLSPLLCLSANQLCIYREALDGDRLHHADALEIALEYRDQVAA